MARRRTQALEKIIRRATFLNDDDNVLKVWDLRVSSDRRKPEHQQAFSGDLHPKNPPVDASWQDCVLATVATSELFTVSEDVRQAMGLDCRFNAGIRLVRSATK